MLLMRSLSTSADSTGMKVSVENASNSLPSLSRCVKAVLVQPTLSFGTKSLDRTVQITGLKSGGWVV